MLTIFLTGIKTVTTESAATIPSGQESANELPEWDESGILEEKQKEYRQQALQDEIDKRQHEANAYLNERGISVPDYIKTACAAAEDRWGVSRYMLEAIAWKESRFRPDAQNGPCKGLMQVNVNLFPHDWTDPQANIMEAARLIDTLGSQGYEDLGAICSLYHGEGHPQYSSYTEDIDRISEALMESEGVY